LNQIISLLLGQVVKCSIELRLYVVN